MSAQLPCSTCGYAYGAHRESDDRCPIVENGVVTGFADTTWTPLEDREEDESD